MQTIRCPYCGDTFDVDYYEKQHVPCPSPRGDKVRDEIRTRSSAIHEMLVAQGKIDAGGWQ